MAFNVTIKYLGKEAAATDTMVVAPIYRLMVPAKSYIDMPAYTNPDYPAHTDPVQTAEEVNFMTRKYATNVDGWGGCLPLPEPYASTSIPLPVPLAQFKLALLSGEEVTFEADFQQAMYYANIGPALISEGFEVTVKSDDTQLFPAVVEEEPVTPPEG